MKQWSSFELESMKRMRKDYEKRLKDSNRSQWMNVGWIVFTGALAVIHSMDSDVFWTGLTLAALALWVGVYWLESKVVRMYRRSLAHIDSIIADLEAR